MEEFMEDYENSVEKAVRLALEKLSFRERETVIRFYCMGQRITEIASYFDLSKNSINHIKSRGIKKLKHLLFPFARDKYGIELNDREICPLCRDKRLDKIILKCAPYGPWKYALRMAKRLKIKDVKAVSTIIYHYKNHISKGNENG
ncbi:MAG: hypothetical protein GF307_10570 [candidate division Zixibacteria bacterium]|nr:hypothetical protein [candidate division Zixibacteria bacterium]